MPQELKQQPSSQPISDVYIKEAPKITINHDSEPQFWRDVTQYLQSPCILIFCFSVFQLTSNMALAGWIIYAGTPLYNLIKLDDHRNVSARNEKAWSKSQLFQVPLYTMIFANLALNLFSLMLFSTKWRPEHWLFDHTFTCTSQYLFYIYGCVYFCSNAQAAGHEVLHNPAPLDKFVGSIPFTSFFYSHFFDEHVRGHHKTIGTDADPVSHAKGTNFYSAMARAAVYTHVETWKRETARLQKKYRSVTVMT